MGRMIGKGKGKAKGRRMTQKGVNAGMRHSHDTLHGQYTGYHSRTVEMRLPRSYRSERKAQFLTHLATAMKGWYSAFPNQSEIEVQIALVNDQYFFISANKNDTVLKLYDKFVSFCASEFMKANPESTDTEAEGRFLSGALREMSRTTRARALTSKARDARRLARHAGKLEKTILGNRNLVTNLNLRLDGQAACIRIDATSDCESRVRDFVAGKLGAARIALVTANIEMHAEQKIMLALIKGCKDTGPQTTAVFAGTFRPCRGCFETLNLVQKYLIPGLQFGSRPGHFWQTTTCAHVKMRDLLVSYGKISPSQQQTDFDENGLLIGLTNVTYRPSLRVIRDEEEVNEEDLHYASESDSDDE